MLEVAPSDAGSPGHVREKRTRRVTLGYECCGPFVEPCQVALRKCAESLI